jgi:hypothetical protein
MQAGLPVEKADPRGTQWRLLWNLFAKYLVLELDPNSPSMKERVRPGSFRALLPARSNRLFSIAIAH